MMAGLAVWVSSMNGSNEVVPPLALLMVLAGVFVPHQLFVAVIAVLTFSRLFPVPVAVLPARRLKLMVEGPPPVRLPVKIPPPLPVAVLPVMVTFDSDIESGLIELKKIPPPFWIPPPLAPAALPLMTVAPPALSMSRFAELQIPPPAPEA